MEIIKEDTPSLDTISESLTENSNPKVVKTRDPLEQVSGEAAPRKKRKYNRLARSLKEVLAEVKEKAERLELQMADMSVELRAKQAVLEEYRKLMAAKM
jgi:hypothetical protein